VTTQGQRRSLVAILVHDKPLALLTLCACIAVTLPAFAARLLPIVDLGGHIGFASVIPRILQHEPIGGQYELAPYPMPYSLVYYSLAALLSFLSTWTVARIFLCVSVLAVPLGLMRLLPALGRDARLGLVAFLVAWDTSIEWGFFAFSLGVGLSLVALAHVLEARTAKDAWRNLPWLLALALTHAQACLFFLGALAIFVCMDKELRSRGFAWVSAVLGILAGLAPWLIATAVHRAGPHAKGKYTFAFTNFEDRALLLAKRAIATAPTWSGDTATWASAAVLLLLPAALWWWTPRQNRHKTPTILAFVVYLEVLYWLTPFSVAWPISQAFIFTRHGALALFAPVLLFTPDLRRPRVLAPVAIATFAALVATSAARWQAITLFEQEVAPFHEIVAHIPPGSRIAHLIPDDKWAFSSVPAALHFDGYVLAERACPTVTLWDTDKLPVLYRGARPTAPFPKEKLTPATIADVGPLVDYILVADHGEYNLLDRMPRAQAQLVFAAGRWRLYRVHIARSTPPGGEDA